MTLLINKQLNLFDSVKQSEKVDLSDCPPIDNSFPVEEADKLAEKESYNKHLYRPNTYLHKWWARRSGTTFRYILKQLVDNDRKRDYLEPGGLEGKIILDPMMGGGTTIHEAIRMGANCIGVDIDPIPVLQTEVALNGIGIKEKEKTFNSFMSELKTEVGKFYKTKCPHCASESEIQFTLHALTRSCKCGEVKVIDSEVLREDDEVTRICAKCNTVYADNHECISNSEQQFIEREQGVCPNCGEKYRDLTEIPYYARYSPFVIVGNCAKHGTFYKTLDDRDRKLIKSADELFDQENSLDRSEFSVTDGPKSGDLIARGIKCYLDLFTRRQLLLLNNAAKFLNRSQAEHKKWLSLLISTSLEFNSLLCGYKGAGKKRPGAIRHVFSHHAYSFPYTALENNSLCAANTSGTLGLLFEDRIKQANKWAHGPVERYVINNKVFKTTIIGEQDQGEKVDSTEEIYAASATGKVRQFYLDQRDFRSVGLKKNSIDFVVTDPPYYDSVQYSNLSEFFRVWLKKLIPQEANWQYDVSLSAVACGECNAESYGNAMTAIWEKCRVGLKKPCGRLIFTFHHWNYAAWTELTLSLKRSGFSLVNRYVISSENPISVHIRDLNALKHDCILVLSPDANASAIRWSIPSSINFGSSHAFCQDCGSILGNMLQSDLTELEIKKQWKLMLGDKSNGKTAI